METNTIAAAPVTTGFTKADLYRLALDARNFEIKLFWERSNYFLVLNTGTAVGYFTSQKPKLGLALAAFGAIVSLLWILVSLGSKFWQVRWERRVHLLESEIAPDACLFAAEWDVIYADVKDGLTWGKHTGVRRFFNHLVASKPSVSFAMIVLSVVFFFMWFALTVLEGVAIVQGTQFP